MTATNNPECPFGSIALSLSGGGVRAVGFHLGTLAYLDRIGLLNNVKILSTVSGGTVVGMGYGVYLMEGKSLGDVYEDLINDIERGPDEPGVLESILAHLRKRRPAAPSGRRNLVTALAQAFDEGFQFCQRRRFDMFWGDKSPNFHLQDIIFNATEFKTGIGFRFHYHDGKSPCNSGSDRVVLPKDFAKQARLADILAASTCIPVGLEPLEFPDDFRWPDDGDTVPKRDTRKVCKNIRKRFHQTFNEYSVALMDGGVYDNQGIRSVLLALELREIEQKKEQQNDNSVDPSTSKARMYFTPLGLMRSGHREPSLLELQSQQAVATPQPIKPAEWEKPLVVLAKCPKCGVELESKEYFDADVERCPRCQGLWLDETEAQDLFGEESDLDLFIVSDTPLREDPIYRIEEPLGRKIFSLRTVRWIANIMVVLSSVSVLYLWLGVRKIPDNIYEAMGGFFIFVLPLLMIMVFLACALTIGYWFRRGLRSIPGLEVSAWKFVKKLKVAEVANMLYLRLKSTWAMTDDIFMNRIRFLGYALLSAQRGLKRKVIANEIDSLLRTKYVRGLPKWLKPTDQMTEAVVPRAAKMPTKLWLDPPTDEKRGDFEVLIACGQATMCFNLLAHMWINCPRKEGKKEKFEDASVQELFDRVKADWLRLTDEAYVFVDERKAAADIMAPVD